MPDFNRHNIDRLFKEGLNNADMPVSNKAWGAIASELEKDQLRRKVLWARSTAVAAVLLLVALGSWTLLNITKQSPTEGNSTTFAVAKQMQKLENSHGIGFVNCDAPSQSVDFQAKNVAVPFLPNLSFKASDIPKRNSAFLPNAALLELLKKVKSNRTAFEVAIENPENSRETMKSRGPFHLASFNATPQRNPLNASKYFEKAVKPNSKKEKEYTFVLEEGDVTKTRKNRRWELGGAVSPDMLFASTTPVQQGGNLASRSASTLADDATSADTKRLSPVTAFSTGLRTGFEINDRFSVRTGLMYTNRQTSSSDNVVGYGKSEFLQNNLNLHYIEVPLTMKYNVVHNSNFDYFVSGGVSGNLFLYYDNSLTTSEGRVAARRVSEKTDALTPSQANLLVSTGMQYRLWNRLSMQLEPGLKYGIKTSDLAFSQSKPLSMSLLSGVSYHF